MKKFYLSETLPIEVIALLKNRKQGRRSFPFKIAGWAQVALLGWMMTWGDYSSRLEYVALGTARIDCAIAQPEVPTKGEPSGSERVNPTQCDGYGALPGTTKPSALIAGANVASQLGWRGHYIDPTGFYYMGARNYAPDSGTFLSPDPLGHSASMDLYSYCDGDPVNNFDPDGRSWNQVFGVVRAGGGVGETAAGYSLAAASAGGGIATAPTGVGPVLGVAGVTAGVAIGAHGLDQIQTGLRQAYYDTPTASFTSQGLKSLGMSSQAANLTDASISIVGSIGAGFATTAIRATALTATSTSAQVASSSMLGKNWVL